MFSKILIANRGEIACRVMRTARRMGIKTVAVFSDADAAALHVREADEGYWIGAAPAAESYLRTDEILRVAKQSGAEAVHPGYGFLSENAGFARDCAAAGITFIGPDSESIEAMGSKSLAKQLMDGAGVPLAPGYQGEDQTPATFAREAARIGYPVLLKAAAGGGGKGMRIVEEASQLEEALKSAQREAMSAFGDDRFLVEKFLTAPRHIEVQVFGDRHGNVVHLYERDCSVQRRYQKVVEEAPAPNLPEAIRTRLFEAAINAAKAVNYVGAGTVEFLYDGADGVYFMEMNTRLQVEHPVTEEVTGLDLVEWQLRVAAGEQLPLEQDQIYCDGHAIEVRIYAEDPAQDYRPSVGPVAHFGYTDVASGTVRVETAVRAGDAITPFYDPMIAKIISRADDRTAAAATLVDALRRAGPVSPLVTNHDFVARILSHPGFLKGEVDTGFLMTYPEVMSDDVPSAAVMALAGLGIWHLPRGHAPGSHLAAALGGWRLNLDTTIERSLVFGATEVGLTLTGQGSSWRAVIGDETLVLEDVRIDAGTRSVSATVGGQKVRAALSYDPYSCAWRIDGAYPFTLIDPGAVEGGALASEASLLAPMPATVTGVVVAAGAKVKAGEVLMTLEAMKMEQLIRAPADGTVAELFFAQGDSVAEGAKLLAFDADE